MKTKRTAIWILACVMVLFAAFAIGCKGKNDKTAKTVKEITLSDATAEIKAGGAIVYADYTVTANYSDGSNKVVPLTEKMFKAEDLAKFENAGTYEIEVSAFGKTTLLTVTVTNYTFEGVTAADVNVVYDGTAKVPTLNNAPAGATAVWTYYAGTDKTGAVVSEAVNAGTYYAEGVVSLKYYNDATVSANVVIAKKAVNPADLKWENLKRVYTGSAIDANVTASDLPEGVTVSYEGDGKTGTAVGKYTVTLKFDDSLSQNYEMTAETYDVEWEIIAPLDATWFGAENGALCVADFKSDSETSGTLTFNGQTTTYTVAFDDKGNATFSGLNGNVTAISLKGGILRLTAGEKKYLLVNKDDLNTYFAGSEYDMLLAQFRIDLNETDKTLKLVVTTEANGEQEYPLTISAGDSETLAKNVKLSASETLYLDYYYSYGVRINGFENPNGYKSESNYVLATKSAVAAALKNLVNGEFKDLDGNTLVVNGYEDIKYNGRAVKLYAVSYYGKTTLYAAINSDKTNAELAPNAGYVKFNNSSFYDKNLIVKAGTYYFEKDGVISDAETFGYLTSSYNYTVTAKILKGETAESKTFTVNGAETADRALLDLGKDGRLTVTLYLKNETEVYATFVVNANGTAVTYGEKTFKKVEKLIEKATGYPSSKYYGADGTVLSYDGKGAFTFTDANGSKVYNKYTLEADGDKLTIKLVNGEDTCTIVSEDPRYITVDNKVYLNERSFNLTNGYNLSATFIAGDSQIVVKNNAVTFDGNALTDLEFNFVDDGNNKGRTVLQIKGKNGEADVSILFYSLAAVKVGNKGYAIQLLSPYYGVTYRPTEDESKSFTFETDGRLMINGKEVFVSSVGNSNVNYYIEDGNLLLECTMYDNSSYGYATIKEGDVQYDYNSDFFMEYRGLYVSEDNASAFAYLKSDTIYASETSYTRCSVSSIDENGTVLNVGSKKATLKTVNGLRVVEYDGKTYNQVKDFSLDAYFGTYSVLNGNNYDSLTVPTNLLTNAKDVSLQKFVMYNGSYAPVIKYNYYNYAYLIKNTDAATATALPYYAINEAYLKYAGDGKLDGKTFEIGFGVGTKDNKKVPVMSVLYDGAALTLTNIAQWKLTARIGEKDYTVEAVTGDEKAYADLMIYESVYGEYKGAYLFNDNNGELAIKVNENGESVIVLKFNDNEVNATFADASFGKTVTFTYNGVDYKGNLVKSSPSVRIVTVAEYEFFFGSTYYESDNAYGVTVNGKTLKFDYEIKSLSQNYSDYQFAFKSLSFDGKAATANAIYYSTAAKTVVFTTADGTYAYNLTTKALTDNVTFEGVAALINNKNTSDGSVYVTARITSVEGKVAKVGLFYDFGNKGGLKAVTATTVEGGYKLSGEGLATTYLLEEGDAYALYTEEQYLLAGTYAIGGKDLVITGTHANGKFTYTAAYGGAEAVAVTPDFTAKSFMIKSATSATMFGWTNENGVLNFTATELPAAALAFLINGDYMINLDSTYNNFEMRVSLKGADNGKVKFNVNYSTGWGSGTTVEGTLSDDGTYISAYVYYSDIQIYVNAVYDSYYKLVAVKKSSAAAKYLGTFTVNETEKVSIALGATSSEDEDGYLDGLDASCFMVTYKGKTVKASTKYSSSVSEIEFTVDGKTYVAKLVDGAMTVTEKAAA